MAVVDIVVNISAILVALVFNGTRCRKLHKTCIEGHAHKLYQLARRPKKSAGEDL